MLLLSNSLAIQNKFEKSKKFKLARNCDYAAYLNVEGVVDMARVLNEVLLIVRDETTGQLDFKLLDVKGVLKKP